MDYNQTPESKHKLTCLCPPPPGAVSILTLLTPGDGTTHSPACSMQGGRGRGCSYLTPADCQSVGEDHLLLTCL